MQMYYLEPKFENVLSYYRKAKIIEDSEAISLYSYDTLIATIKGNEIKLNKNIEVYTQTTRRHLNEFLQQFNFNKLNLNEIRKQLQNNNN